MLNKELEELKNRQSAMNNTINEIKNTLQGTISRITEAEEQISELEDRMVEITAKEQNKGKRMKRVEDSLRDLWDNIKHQIRLVAQSCPTLCNPMNCSTPRPPFHHQLPEFTQTHIHRVSDAIQPSHPLSSPWETTGEPPAPNPSQHQSLFK